MKYIIGRNRAGLLLPLVFDAHIRHKDVAKVALVDCEIVSAGVCSLSKGRVICCGESRSLEVTPSKDDSAIIAKFLRS